ncbi:mannosyl-oligosaccharide glucosidase isoform X2 [Plutella xylostella]|uniref:mannosyl-oligosaccharide glucosidase isoform X1 n=1 Tax=Plutella xylostella TaxID=51655 RepID=UPI002032F064|nr:mannosyl-oligosaccharide glucosidase isoform X1 [Plutella xylostella]XP_048485862.1 mannosyl-oligosaccharide glucosidase isoform X2 [Plutella xylostella]
MPRPRKVVQIKLANDNGTSSSSSSSECVESRAFKILSIWKTGVGVACFIIAVYVGTLGYLETRVNTPFDDEKIIGPTDSGIYVPERYWGSYRPGNYFGMKTRDPRSPVMGLMWYEPTTGHKGIRHWCDQADNLASYGWVRHDGVHFGEQVIEDSPHTLTTSFIKTLGGEYGGHWTARIDVKSEGNASHPFTLIWYAALDESLGPAAPHSRLWMEGGALMGHTPQLNNFRMTLVPKGKLVHTSYSEANAAGLHVLKEKVYSLLRVERHPELGRHAVLAPDHELKDHEKDVNFVAIQLLVNTPFTLDVVYTTEDLPTPPLKGDSYTEALEEKRRTFDEQFEETFKLAEKGYSQENISIARAAFSNCLGGVGYFYGAGRVQSSYTKEPVPYWKAPLYTAVPSRSFFPRGFLWDEGFHGLLLGRWSPELQLDVAAHWLDLINVEGWIPREQILGAEALARVPKEFVVQSNAAANPPMLLLQVAKLAQRPEFAKPGPLRAKLHRCFTRLQAWYFWFLNSQRGDQPTSFRWRGRTDDNLQLNPKTLSSGLDDYPRASHPTDGERHVDLRCWVYAAADAMTTIARVLDWETDKFEVTRDQLRDEDLLNELHWSPHTGTYADYGLHTDGVRLVRQSPKSVKPPDTPRVLRSVTTAPSHRLVTSAFGYISLFPMLLKVLSPDSDKLGKILEDLDKPDLLWSPYGLRSLSKSSPLYMKRNTEHDPPYWRGQVWVNINYLALGALQHYGRNRGPHAARALDLRRRLRDNLVNNILTQYKKTGYFWEQYSGEDGRGSGCRPFTGWTALVVLIMAEDY